MSAKILDGKATSKTILNGLEDEIKLLVEKEIFPKLAIILVGNNPASKAYVRVKKRALDSVGAKWEEFLFDEAASTDDLIMKIEDLNEDKSFHGILVQLPLPTHIVEADVIHAISPIKDVDGFTAYNIGSNVLDKNSDDFAPCTPVGVVRLLETYNIPLSGKEVVVVGRSNIVGKPLAILMSNKDATVTLCHSKTKNLDFHTIRADILCVAVGKKGLIRGEMVKKGAVVVDIGFNREDDGKIVGDVVFDEVSKKADYITPVPGGVGPMTVACLVENLVKGAKKLLV